MAPSESYQHVVKGGLKFKGGGGLPTAGGVKKKKKKKDKKVRSIPAPLGRLPSPIPPEISPKFHLAKQVHPQNGEDETQQEQKRTDVDQAWDRYQQRVEKHS